MVVPSSLSHILQKFWKEEYKVLSIYLVLAGIGIFICLLAGSVFLAVRNQQASTQLNLTEKQIKTLNTAFLALKNQDQYKRNETLQATISAIEKTYSQSVADYNTIMDLTAQKVDTTNDLTLFT